MTTHTELTGIKTAGDLESAFEILANIMNSEGPEGQIDEKNLEALTNTIIVILRDVSRETITENGEHREYKDLWEVSVERFRDSIMNGSQENAQQKIKLLLATALDATDEGMAITAIDLSAQIMKGRKTASSPALLIVSTAMMQNFLRMGKPHAALAGWFFYQQLARNYPGNIRAQNQVALRDNLRIILKESLSVILRTDMRLMDPIRHDDAPAIHSLRDFSENILDIAATLEPKPGEENSQPTLADRTESDITPDSIRIMIERISNDPRLIQ